MCNELVVVEFISEKQIILSETVDVTCVMCVFRVVPAVFRDGAITHASVNFIGSMVWQSLLFKKSYTT